MKFILGKFHGQKIRVPEFHKNGKRNKLFSYYKKFVDRDVIHNFNHSSGPKMGQNIGQIVKTRLRIKEVGK